MGILNEIKKEVTSDSFRSISGMVFAVEREEVSYLELLLVEMSTNHQLPCRLRCM